jgi:repressor LexA
MKQLTLRQQEILDFLTSFIEKNSFPPTVRETAKAFSISIKGAYDHIKALEKKGVIKLQENRSRALEIVSKKGNDESVAEIPVLGNIAAGNPILAEENWMGTMRVPS